MAKTYIGGQALIEGVMMRGKNVSALAVRDETGVIRLETKRIKPVRGVWTKIPVVRGVINFFVSLVTGTKSLMRASEVFMEDSAKKATSEKQKGNALLLTITMIVSLAFAIGLFFVLPNLLITLLTDVFNADLSPIVRNLVEGLVRITVFILYIVAISGMKEIRRVFQYHGAEHSTISCFENELELTKENVLKCSTVHDRCGTSFMFFVMVVAIVVFAVVDWLAYTVIGLTEGVLTRLALRIIFLPIVAGLSYELLKFLAKTKSPFWAPLKWPGAMLQKLTTKKPDGDMAEVAIAAFKAVLERENNPDVPDVKFPGEKPLGEFKSEMTAKMKQAGMDDFSDIDWILCDVTNLKRDELKDDVILSAGMQIRAEKYLTDRLTGKPLQYVFGNTEFLGRKFKVDERALIPRFETELLMEKVLPYIKKESRVMDLCCGSGVIGITARLEKGCETVCCDVSESALELTAENAKLFKADIKTVKSDLFENINGTFDVIISNPPYIKTEDIAGLESCVKDFEPVLALDGGADGLDFYRRIIAGAPRMLNANGILAFEAGMGQADAITALTINGFEAAARFDDFNGIARILIFKKV